MATRISNNQRMLAAGAVLVVVASGAYYVGRIYPPRAGDAQGTIAPANRYQASQVQSADVGLGDTSVAALMQTDAFELMVKDANFRALATNPAFMALAQQNPQALAAMAQNPAAFSALAKDPKAFAALAGDAKAYASLSPAAQDRKSVV